jgi:hypothetical protein
MIFWPRLHSLTDGEIDYNALARRKNLPGGDSNNAGHGSGVTGLVTRISEVRVLGKIGG